MPPAYPQDFKLSAIQMVLEHGRSVSEAAKNLGICPSTLRGWIKKHQADHAPSSSATAQDDDLQAQNKRLREENARLKVEREILKKAAAFFAKEQP